MNKFEIGVDVSSYQGVIDWAKVKKAGVEFAILKVIRKDLNPDKQFEANWAGCSKVNMIIQGVYNYSYATTVSKARSDAKRVIEVLAGRKTMVWLDVEDKCQEGLGSTLIDIINAYAEVIMAAGLEFGVYTGQHFYNTNIAPFGGIRWPKWIARYGQNDGTLNEKYKPNVSEVMGWQYTSAGSVDGISGKVDMNVWYEEIQGAEITKKSIREVAKEVVDGLWGNGSKRKEYLEAAGYNYAEVQAMVNSILGKKDKKTIEEVAEEVIAGLWGNGFMRNENLRAEGYDAARVQKKVNEILKASLPVYHTVKKGNTISGIAKQYETTVSAIAELNNLKDINKIYVNQKIRVK